jgi:hypothetical protein
MQPLRRAKRASADAARRVTLGGLVGAVARLVAADALQHRGQRAEVRVVLDRVLDVGGDEV